MCVEGGGRGGGVVVARCVCVGGGGGGRVGFGEYMSRWLMNEP